MSTDAQTASATLVTQLQTLKCQLLPSAWDDAFEKAQQHLRQHPNDAPALQALGSALVMRNRFDLALPHLLAAWHLIDTPMVQYAAPLVTCCAQLGLVDLGAQVADQLQPHLYPRSDQWAWHGILLVNLNLLERAAASLQQGLEVYENDVYLKQVLGSTLIAQGNWEAGLPLFANYSSRAFMRQWYDKDFDEAWLSKYWDGEDLRGKRLLYRGSVSDYLQFARYAQGLLDMGAQEVLAILPNPRLRGLVQRIAGLRICDSFTPLDDVDYWVDPFSLAAHMQPQLGFLRQSTHLQAPPSLYAERTLPLIRQRAAGKRSIAISWHSDMPDGERRSVPLAELLPLFGRPDIHWVIMQRGIALQDFLQTGLARQCTVVSGAATFDDAAALLVGLDGLVTIESYHVHMGGGLGVPTFFMASRALDWRHGNQERESIWYDSVQLVRQPRLGGWRSVVLDLMQRLSQPDKSR